MGDSDSKELIRYKIEIDTLNQLLKEQEDVTIDQSGKLEQKVHELHAAVEALNKEIAERKKIERDLIESDLQIRTVLATIKEGVIFSNEQGHFEVYNAEMQRLTGYSIEEANECSDFDRLIYPDLEQREKARQGLAALLQNNKAQERESIIKSKSGELKNVLIYSAIVVYKNRRMFLSTYRDITERKKIAEEVEKSRQRFRALFENVPFGMMIVSNKKTIVEINNIALELLQRKREDVIGKICHQFVCPAEEGQCPIFDKGSTVNKEERIVLRFDGSEIPVLKSVVRIEIEGSEFLIESFIDITERKKAERELFKAKDELEERVKARTAEVAKIAESEKNKAAEAAKAYEALKEKTEVLERFQKVTIDRAFQMIDLKKEINILLKKLGQSIKYETLEQ